MNNPSKSSPESPAKEQPGEVAAMVRRLLEATREFARDQAGVSILCSEAAALLEKLGSKAQVMHDLHDALGVKWGCDPYAEIKRLKSIERAYEDILRQRPPPSERP